MKATRILILFVLSLAGLAFAQDVTGDWHGTLRVNGAELRLVLHVSKNSDGTLKAALDSIDQNANGIPVTSATLGGSVLSLNVEAVHGSYEGKVNAAGTEIAGTWTQGVPLKLTFNRGGIPAKAAAGPSDIDGDWLGTIDTAMGKLRLVLHISNTDQGLAATVDSPDQNAKGLAVTSIVRGGSSLKFEMKAIDGAYEGTISSDLDSFTGNWTQLGNRLPLSFKRVKSAAELDRARPQNPSRPYPYREENVRYKNPVANIELAATLTIPPGKGPFPAVLLIPGSGPHDRDETMMGHKPFLVLSDHLTRKGIVVLRADKRGVGNSGGTYADAIMADFASDSDAGVAFLKTRSEVDPHKIGLVGHSEGAIEAPMSAMHNADVAFVVLMAGPGVRGDLLLPEQLKLIEQAIGKNPEEIEKDLATEHVVLAILEKEKDDSVREKELRESLKGKVPDAQIAAQIKALDSSWLRGLLEYDPAVTLSQIKCPVLVLNGEKDLQVPPEQNLPPIRKALENAGNTNFEVDELPGLNHLFQTAKTGAVGEYSEIQETISPVVLEKIASWILKQTKTESRPANVAAIQSVQGK